MAQWFGVQYIERPIQGQGLGKEAGLDLFEVKSQVKLVYDWFDISRTRSVFAVKLRGKTKQFYICKEDQR